MVLFDKSGGRGRIGVFNWQQVFKKRMFEFVKVSALRPVLMNHEGHLGALYRIEQNLFIIKRLGYPGVQPIITGFAYSVEKQTKGDMLVSP